MTTIATTQNTTTSTALWRPTVIAGIAAAAATAAFAAVAHAAGVSLLMSGEEVPPTGFATMTVAAVVLGYFLAVGLRRWAANPRRAFVRSTVALTVLSFVPDLLVSVSAGMRLTLMAAHVVAAVIVIPAIASRLARD